MASACSRHRRFAWKAPRIRSPGAFSDGAFRIVGSIRRIVLLSSFPNLGNIRCSRSHLKNDKTPGLCSRPSFSRESMRHALFYTRILGWVMPIAAFCFVMPHAQEVRAQAAAVDAINRPSSRPSPVPPIVTPSPIDRAPRGTGIPDASRVATGFSANRAMDARECICLVAAQSTLASALEVRRDDVQEQASDHLLAHHDRGGRSRAPGNGADPGSQRDPEPRDRRGLRDLLPPRAGGGAGSDPVSIEGRDGPRAPVLGRPAPAWSPGAGDL